MGNEAKKYIRKIDWKIQIEENISLNIQVSAHITCSKEGRGDQKEIFLVLKDNTSKYCLLALKEVGIEEEYF